MSDPGAGVRTTLSSRGRNGHTARRRGPHAGGERIHSSEAASARRARQASAAAAAGSDAWVPASVHPEVSPVEFKHFVAAQAERAMQREKELVEDAPDPEPSPTGLARKPSRRAQAAVGPSGELDPALSGLIRKKSLSRDQHLRADLITRSTSLTRRASKLRKQLNPNDQSSIAEETGSESSEPANLVERRPSHRTLDDRPPLSPEDLRKLERMTEQASISNDPVALRQALHRTISLSSQSAAFDRVDDIPPPDEEPRRGLPLPPEPLPEPLPEVLPEPRSEPTLKHSLVPAAEPEPTSTPGYRPSTYSAALAPEQPALAARPLSTRLNRSTHPKRHPSSSSDGHGNDTADAVHKVTSPDKKLGSHESIASDDTSTQRSSTTSFDDTSASEHPKEAWMTFTPAHPSTGTTPTLTLAQTTETLAQTTDEPPSTPRPVKASSGSSLELGEEVFVDAADKPASTEHGTGLLPALPLSSLPSLTEEPAEIKVGGPVSRPYSPPLSQPPHVRPTHERSRSMPLPGSTPPVSQTPTASDMPPSNSTQSHALRRTASPAPSITSTTTTSSKRKSRSGFAAWFGSRKDDEEVAEAKQKAQEAAEAKKQAKAERKREKERSKHESDSTSRFLGLFSKKKHTQEDKPALQVAWNPSGRRPGTTGPGGRPIAQNQAQVGLRAPWNGVDYYSRFPIPIERAIYRLSHFKLASPKRSLCEQVLITELMYWYLGIINRPAQPQQGYAPEYANYYQHSDPASAGHTAAANHAAQAVQAAAGMKNGTGSAGAAHRLVQQIAPERAAASPMYHRPIGSSGNSPADDPDAHAAEAARATAQRRQQAAMAVGATVGPMNSVDSESKTRWGIPGQPANVSI